MDETIVDEFLDRWHRMVREKNSAAIPGLLADDVKLGAPPYWGKVEGKEIVAYLLGLILQTIEGFEYQREWRNGAELALEFTGTVDGNNLQGIDLITVNSGGLLAAIDVPMRPIKTIAVLRDKIGPLMTTYIENLSQTD